MEQDLKNTFANQRLQRMFVLLLLALSAFVVMKTINEFKEYRFIGGGVPATNTVTVSGEGEVFAVPDIATFSFSVIEEKPNAKGAQEVATEKINTILAFVRDSGVEERDIKTVSYNLYPRYEYIQEVCNEFRCPPGERVLRGFEVNQTIEVKIRDTSEAGAIVAGVGERGVSNVSGLTFTIDDEDALKADARKKAINDARAKAKVLAGDLGVQLVRVVSFSESGGTPVYPRFGIATQERGADDAGAPLPAPEIPAGENKLISRVSITYEIR